MEFQFSRSTIPCMKQILRERTEQEMTQEIKLSDSLPDVGRILASWGQVLVRSKEWRTGELGVSGAVMVSILYAPEDGSEPRCMDGWIPFQMKWDIPRVESDGVIIASGTLVNLDARTVSARKILVRANVGMIVRGTIPDEVEIYAPENLPEDIQLLQRSYPVKIPKEAGEKVFLLDEELTIPASAPQIQKILHYSVLPDLIDRKVMADKVVFRGIAVIHVLYSTEEGKLESIDLDMPFSQYKDLEYSYEQNADAQVHVALTSLELEQGDGDSLYLKAGMVGQYVVFDAPVITVAEDAYSTGREISIHTASLELPAVLDTQTETIHATTEMEAKGIQKPVEFAFMMGNPVADAEEDGVDVQICGKFVMLYYNEDGTLETASERWKGSKKISVNGNGTVDPWAGITGRVHGSAGMNNANTRADICMTMQTIGGKGIPMITGLSVEDSVSIDPNRPSMILRRIGEEDLWQIAKQSRSTVEAIRSANGLQAEPESGRFLLIPIA